MSGRRGLALLVFAIAPSVVGLAAQARTPNRARSRAAYTQFLANWRLADQDRPELAETRAGVGR